MNRVSLVALSLSSLVAVLGGTGCVSLDKYNKLHVSNVQCESERTELRNQLAVANTKLDEMQKAIAGSEADKATRILQLMAQITNMKDAYDKLAADNAGLQEQLKNAKPPVINVYGPRLAPEVNEALKKFAQDHPGLIDYDEQKGLIRFSSDLLFDSGSFELRGEIAKQLSDFAEVINIPAARQYDVLVVGHTDSQPVSKPATRARTPTNWHLSVFRAVSVVAALAHDRVDASRLAAMGFGEERPRVAKKGNVKENRRVEIYLVPKGSLTTSGAVQGTDVAPAPAPAKVAPVPEK